MTLSVSQLGRESNPAQWPTDTSGKIDQLIQSSPASPSMNSSGMGQSSALQQGTRVASVTLNGNMFVGADFLRAYGGFGQWGYIAIDPLSAGLAGAKLLQNKPLSDKDVVSFRMQIEGGFEGIQKIPGIGPKLVEMLHETYPNSLQSDFGAYANVQVSGRSDGKPGVQIKSFDLIAYLDFAAPPGLVSVKGGKVSAGNLDKNFSGYYTGISYTPETGFKWGSNSLQGTITNVIKPPNATNVNGSFFDGWSVLGVMGNDATATTMLGTNALAGQFSSNGNSTGSKIASAAGFTANMASGMNDLWTAMNGKKELINGKPKETTMVGVTMGVFRPAGPRLTPAPVPLIRLIGTATAVQDGNKNIDFNYNGQTLFSTTMQKIQAGTQKVLDALESIPGVSLLTHPQLRPSNAVAGSLYDPKELAARQRAGQAAAIHHMMGSVAKIPSTDHQAAPQSAAVGQQPTAWPEVEQRILKGSYSTSRKDTIAAYQMTAILPPGPRTDMLRAKLMTDYVHGCYSTVRNFIGAALQGQNMTTLQRRTIVDLRNLTQFTNQLRAKVGYPPIEITNLSNWADYAQTGKLPQQ